MTTADDADYEQQADAARAALVALVREYGTYYGAKVNEITGQPGECWTHAWTVAAALPGRTYVEGVCALRGVTEAHAWTVDAAGIVYEHTEGYERAGYYVGLPIDTAPGSEARRLDALAAEGDEPRCSMVEALLAAGAAPALIVRNIGKGTPR